MITKLIKVCQDTSWFVKCLESYMYRVCDLYSDAEMIILQTRTRYDVYFYNKNTFQWICQAENVQDLIEIVKGVTNNEDIDD